MIDETYGAGRRAGRARQALRRGPRIWRGCRGPRGFDQIRRIGDRRTEEALPTEALPEGRGSRSTLLRTNHAWTALRWRLWVFATPGSVIGGRARIPGLLGQQLVPEGLATFTPPSV